jgi:UDPglucose 6-dehydrogenase
MTGRAVQSSDVARLEMARAESTEEATPRSLDVAVVGLGYVGLVTSACLATLGHNVRGIEADPRRLSELQAGRMPFHEPGLAELVGQVIADGRLSFSSPDDIAEIVFHSDLVILAVGTHDGNGRWQTNTIQQAFADVAPFLPNGTPIIVRSTLPPDYLPAAERLVCQIRAEHDLPHVPVLLNPEFTREGRAIADFLHPDRVVIGVLHDPDGAGESAVRQMYARLDAPILTMSGIDAGLAKLGSNLFLATKISFANELGRLCDTYGGDVAAVVDAVGYDQRIGHQFLNAGLGFGGSCLPNQVTMMIEVADDLGAPAHLLAAVGRINEEQPIRFARRLFELSGVDAPRVALLGLTFKPDTDDLRDAPSLAVARELVALGARPVAYDPMPSARRRAAEMVPGLEVVETLGEALAFADGIGLITEWDVFRRIDWKAARLMTDARIVLDGRNALDEETVTAAGFLYEGIGRRRLPDTGLAVRDVTTIPQLLEVTDHVAV